MSPAVRDHAPSDPAGQAVDVVILTARADEQAAIVNAVGNCTARPSPDGEMSFGDIRGQRVLLFPIDHMGSASAVQAAESLIHAWRPGLLMLVGIAAGAPEASDDMRRGDVLVPDQIVGYELAKVTKSRLERRYEVYRADSELLRHAQGLRPSDWADEIPVPRPDDLDGRIRPRVHVGPILTGDKVLANSKTLAELRQCWPTSIGIEMESLGVAMAAHRSRVRFLMVKAVSDLADDQKDDTWRHYAAAVAAHFAVALLARCPGTLSGEPRSPAEEAAPERRSQAASTVHQQFDTVTVPGSAVFGISYGARGDN